MRLFNRLIGPLPAGERDRQRAVEAVPGRRMRSFELDRIAAAAANLCGVATGLVTIIDGEEMLTPGQFNARLRDVPRAESVCGQAILHPGEVLCIPDLQAGQPWSRLSVARGPEAIRFYAGAPLLSPDGHALGMLCALDPDPRAPISEDQRGALRRLARLAVPRLLAGAPLGPPDIAGGDAGHLALAR